MRILDVPPELPEGAVPVVAPAVEEEPDLPETMPAEELPAEIASGGAQ
jgi:hypothetical protein